MSDFDFEDPPASGGEESEHEGSSADEDGAETQPSKKQRLSLGSSRSIQSKAKAQPKAKGKAKAVVDKACYISGCPEKKSGKHRSCGGHKKTLDAILYQAEKSGKKSEVEKILSDPVMASKAVRDFEAENPPGKFRKKLIDFTQWLKTYSTETSQTNRELCELYTFQDFSDEKTAAGWDPKAILSKWQEYDNDPNIEREDDDGLWLPKRKQKMRDQTKRITQSVVEGSKSMKGLKAADVEVLKNFALTSTASHTNAFLRSGDTAQKAAAPSMEVVDLEAAVEDPKKKKGKRVDLAQALPAVSEKELAQLQRLKEQMNSATCAAAEAIAQVAEPGATLSQAGQAFLDACEMRKRCADVWLLEDDAEKLKHWQDAHKDSDLVACVTVSLRFA